MAHDNKMNNELLAMVFGGEKTIRYKVIDDKILICATDLANPLGVSRRTIRRNMQYFDETERVYVEMETGGGLQTFAFVTMTGLIDLLGCCRPKPGTEAFKFKKWMTKKIVELLERGKTRITQQETNIRLVEAMAAFAKGYENTMTYLKEKQTQAIVTNTTQYVKESMEDQSDDIKPLTIQQRLMTHFDIDNVDKVVKYSIGLGRKVAKSFRERNGGDPDNTGQWVYGNAIRSNVNQYDLDDYIEWIDAIIEEYLADRD